MRFLSISFSLIGDDIFRILECIESNQPYYTFMEKYSYRKPIKGQITNKDKILRNMKYLRFTILSYKDTVTNFAEYLSFKRYKRQ